MPRPEQCKASLSAETVKLTRGVLRDRVSFRCVSRFLVVIRQRVTIVALAAREGRRRGCQGLVGDGKCQIRLPGKRLVCPKPHRQDRINQSTVQLDAVF